MATLTELLTTPPTVVQPGAGRLPVLSNVKPVTEAGQEITKLFPE